MDNTLNESLATPSVVFAKSGVTKAASGTLDECSMMPTPLVRRRTEV
jgi:hypothetical protein